MVQKRCACGFGISDSETMCDSCKTKKHISKRNNALDPFQQPISSWLEGCGEKNVSAGNEFCVVTLSWFDN